MQSIHDLELNEVLCIATGCSFRRVPSGWIVTQWHMNDGGITPILLTSCFVPFSDEFAPVALNTLLNKDYTELQYNCRAKKILAKLGVKTIRDITKLTAKELAETRNCGETTIIEIRTGLMKLGLDLRDVYP